ncbi:MAG: GH92 family glycosyl hydrolase [Bacteroidales bacterium]|nr:GH92 family glycosyl hydrolase [Bacteroidales bacterium]
MTRRLSFLFCLLTALSCTQNIDFVNPFIGTDYNGHTFPGACYPLGYVQAGPTTGMQGWDYCSGYRYTDTLMLGFTQTRLSGTGCADLGDLLVMPYSSACRDNYASAMDKSCEKATPGYYRVHLTENAVTTEITSSPHVAFYRFTYDGQQRNLYLDFNSVVGHNRILSSDVKVLDNKRIEGSLQAKGWVERSYCFAICLDAEFTSLETLDTDESLNAPRYALHFPEASKPVQMKIALSTVSTEGAWENMRTEVPGWSFSSVLGKARDAWDKVLSLIDIEGSDSQKTNFYTALYHLYIQPNNIADVDGRYNGADNRIHNATTGRHFSTLSQWDTFRAADPFYNLMTPEFGGELAASMIQQCEEQGFLPIWALCGKENYCMIGNHSVPHVVDAALMGLPGVDAEKAYEAVRRSLTVSHHRSDWELYDQYGYFPYDAGFNESVSKTLECGYDDYCAALLAEKLGKKEDAEFFYKRSQYYHALFDPSTGLARGKKKDGQWREPFYPFSYAHDSQTGGDYTEGNAWQYTWHVLQDVDGLIAELGGKEAFVEKLDSLFVFSPDEGLTGRVPDVSGLIGQYAHGNEPSHHVAYLYTLAGRSDRTAEVIGEVFDRLYTPTPDGLCGNEDCGQMSAWYLFSSCGFYPVNPVSGEFVLGAPQIPRATWNLPNGKRFTIIAEGLDASHRYVSSVTLNGQALTDRITREQILAGGTLVFKMTVK